MNKNGNSPKGTLSSVYVFFYTLFSRIKGKWYRNDATRPTSIKLKVNLGQSCCTHTHTHSCCQQNVIENSCVPFRSPSSWNELKWAKIKQKNDEPNEKRKKSKESSYKVRGIGKRSEWTNEKKIYFSFCLAIKYQCQNECRRQWYTHTHTANQHTHNPHQSVYCFAVSVSSVYIFIAYSFVHSPKHFIYLYNAIGTSSNDVDNFRFENECVAVWITRKRRKMKMNQSKNTKKKKIT